MLAAQIQLPNEAFALREAAELSARERHRLAACRREGR